MSVFVFLYACHKNCEGHMWKKKAPMLFSLSPPPPPPPPPSRPLALCLSLFLSVPFSLSPSLRHQWLLVLVTEAKFNHWRISGIFLIAWFLANHSWQCLKSVHGYLCLAVLSVLKLGLDTMALDSSLHFQLACSHQEKHWACSQRWRESCWGRKRKAEAYCLGCEFALDLFILYCAPLVHFDYLKTFTQLMCVAEDWGS